MLIEPFTPSAHNDGVGGAGGNGWEMEKPTRREGGGVCVCGGRWGDLDGSLKEQLQRLRFSDGFPRHIENTQHTTVALGLDRRIRPWNRCRRGQEPARSQGYQLAAAVSCGPIVCVCGKDICLTMKFNGVL